MDTSNITTPQLMVKYIQGNMSPAERVLLDKRLEESPVLKDKLEELSDLDNWWDCFWYQHDIDTEEAWQRFEKEHITEFTPDTGIQINWFQTLLSAVAILLIVGAVTYAIVNVIISNHADVAEVQSEPNSFEPGSVAKFLAGGYWDLADKGRLNLKDIHQERIELSGSSILNQGEMFTIESNDVDRTPPRIIKLVTAEKQIKLQLPDGSRITLNKKSSIEFSLPFDNGQRKVGLWGEAYFEVESNSDLPFVVQLNNKVAVQAYGTVFTVSCSEKECYTTLLRGHVTVTNDGQTKTLKEGDQLQIIAGDQAIKVEKADPEKAIAWTRKNGFDYKNIGFKQMMQEIGGWFGYSVVFNGDMPQKNYDIKINEEDNLEFLLEAIEKKDNVKIKIADKKIIINGMMNDDISSGFKFQAAPFKP